MKRQESILRLFEKKKMLENKDLKSNIENIQSKLLKEYENAGLIQIKSNFAFTDKSLENFFFIGWVKEILPNMKVINCRRNPLSCIMSILKNNLVGIPWAHNLDHIFEYFDIYYNMIDYWKKLYPDFMYELQYEKFVKNPEIESRKVLQYCDLPWDEKCLEYYKRNDVICKTASNMQIRKPIYKDSIDKYKPYEHLLEKYTRKYAWFNQKSENYY